MRTLFCIALVMLAGCVPPEDVALERKRGEARITLFNSCMELAAKMPRQSDDDVSDIVSECSSQAYYQSNSLHPRGGA